MVEFKWYAGFEAKEGLLTEPYKIAGTLVDATLNKNKFRIDEGEFPSIEAQVPSGTLRVDHGKSVRDVVGGFNSAKWDPETKKLGFEAEIDDPQIQLLAKKGRIKYISIGASADAFCSSCGKPAGPLRNCKCKGAHDVIKNVKFKEGSIVLEPAYESAEWKPVDFMASLDSALSNEIIVTPDSPALKADEGGKQKNIVEDKKMSETKTEIEGGTQLKSAGPDAVILLAEKMAKLEATIATMKAEKKAKEDDEVKKNDVLSTKLDTILSKMDEKKKKGYDDDDDDEDGKKVKKGKEKKKDDDECMDKKGKKDEDEDEDEKKEDEDDDEKKESKNKEKCSDCGHDKDECTCKEKKKEPVRAGAKVGDAEIEGVQTEEIRYGVKVPTWVAEVVDKATKEGWFD